MLYSSKLHIDFIKNIHYNYPNKSKEADKMTVMVYEQHDIITRSAVLSALFI